MFSKKMVLIVGIIALVAVNITILFIGNRKSASRGYGQVAIFFVAPFQDAVTDCIHFVKNIWYQYFYLVSLSEDNKRLKKSLCLAAQKNNRCKETELSNLRLRRLLNFTKTVTDKALAAEVVGIDPSQWNRTIIVDKGKIDGVEKGMPVVIPEGIAGQVIDISSRYSKVLLIIDSNSSVDALVQRTRARGIIKGESSGSLIFEYALRKHDIKVGDTIISSGLDGVFPKGLYIGYVSTVVRRNAGIFQDINITPYVDFEKLEEVLILLNLPECAGLKPEPGA